jgi:hypothetical protein
MTDEPEPPAILAGDRDRDGSIEVLSGAVAEGRLTLEEFSDRVGLAQTARTQSELAVLTRDLPARSSFRCIFGTVVLDLSQARLSGSELELEVYNLFGTVTVIVPEEIQVSVTGGGLFASQVIKTAAGPSVAGTPRLRISARGPGGTLTVRGPREPPGSRLARLLGAGDSGKSD